MTIPGYTSLSTSPTAPHNPPWTRGWNNSGFIEILMMMIDSSIMMMTNTNLQDYIMKWCHFQAKQPKLQHCLARIGEWPGDKKHFFEYKKKIFKKFRNIKMLTSHIQISWPLNFAGMPGPFPLLISNAADAESHKVRPSSSPPSLSSSWSNTPHCHHHYEAILSVIVIIKPSSLSSSLSSHPHCHHHQNGFRLPLLCSALVAHLPSDHPQVQQ